MEERGEEGLAGALRRGHKRKHEETQGRVRCKLVGRVSQLFRGPDKFKRGLVENMSNSTPRFSGASQDSTNTLHQAGVLHAGATTARPAHTARPPGTAQAPRRRLRAMLHGDGDCHSPSPEKTGPP